MRTSSTNRVDTKRAPRRELHLSTLADVLAEAERLAGLEAAGTLRRSGNWTLGQCFNHVASWANYPYDGYPMRTPWFVKLFGRIARPMIFKRPFPTGMTIPKAEGGTYGIEPMSTADGLKKLRSALARLAEAPPAAPNPVFGKLSHEQWKQMTIKHAELHFSFQDLGR